MSGLTLLATFPLDQLESTTLHHFFPSFQIYFHLFALLDYLDFPLGPVVHARTGTPFPTLGPFPPPKTPTQTSSSVIQSYQGKRNIRPTTTQRKRRWKVDVYMC